MMSTGYKRRSNIILVVLIVFASAIFCQSAAKFGENFWVLQYPAHQPPPRYGPAIAADPLHDTVVLFGGCQNIQGDLYGDTWIWNGEDWEEKHPFVNPPPRKLAKMAFDPLRGRLVMFGGSTEQGFLFDTWEWDGKEWLQPNPAPAPRLEGYVDVHLIWSPRLERVVLIYVLHTPEPRTEFFEIYAWDGMEWIWQGQTPPSHFIPDLMEASFDARRNCLFFGGCSIRVFTLYGLDQMLIWGGGEVVFPETSPRPRGRWEHGMCASHRTGRTMVFGGLHCDGHCWEILDDTWVWDGAAWHDLYVDGPPPRRYFGFAFEGEGETALLYGGMLNDVWNDTWVLHLGGDANRDGKLNVFDPLLLRLNEDGLMPPGTRPRLDSQAVDLDGDGLVTAADRRLLCIQLAEGD